MRGATRKAVFARGLDRNTNEHQNFVKSLIRGDVFYISSDGISRYTRDPGAVIPPPPRFTPAASAHDAQLLRLRYLVLAHGWGWDQSVLVRGARHFGAL